MQITEEKAKELWTAWHDEILHKLSQTNRMLFQAKKPANFSDWLQSKAAEQCHHYTFTYDKIKYYGKVIFSVLVHAENGKMYFEKVYYPLSKGAFRRRISVDMGIELSKHCVERFIERWQIDSLDRLQNDVLEHLVKPVVMHGANENTGSFDLTTAGMLLTRESLFPVDIDTEKNVTSFITVMSHKELSRKKQDMIHYILNKVDCNELLLACSELPKSTIEADRVIESTKLRQTPPMPFWETDEHKEAASGKHHVFKMLQSYDPAINIS